MGYYKSRCGIALWHILGFAQSSHGLIKDVIDLLRIFQRLSASRTFYARLSGDCIQLYQWAIDFISTIFEAIIPKEHLSMYELFQLYCLVSTVFLANLILILLTHHQFINYIPINLLSLLFGVGFGYVGVQGQWAVIMLSVASGVALLTIICYNIHALRLISEYLCLFPFNIRKLVNTKAEDLAKDLTKKGFVKFTMMSIAAGIVFASASFAIIIKHRVIGFYIIIIISGIIVLTFVIELIKNHLDGESEEDSEKKQTSNNKTQNQGIDEQSQSNSKIKDKIKLKAQDHVVDFTMQMVSLCIIPSTELFANLMSTNFGARWCVVVSFLALTVILPIIITLILLWCDYESLTDQYRDIDLFFCCCDIKYLQVVDIIQKVAYALLATFDISSGCIALEIAYLLLIIRCPYNNVSDNVLAIGETLVLIVANIASILGSKVFSFEVSISVFAAAWVPVVLATILYFLRDFENAITAELHDPDHEIETDSFKNLSFSFVILAPLSWLFFGTNLRLMISTIIIN